MKRIMMRIVLGTAAILALLYIGDYLRLRYKMRNPNAGQAFGSVKVYDTVTLKGNKTEILFDQPQSVTCVYSWFPQVGDNPCWYVSRRTVKGLE